MSAPQVEYAVFVLGPAGYAHPDTGLRDPAYYAFPCLPQARSSRLAIFPRRNTQGAPDPDADDTLSTVNWMDLTGGVGNRVINPSSDLHKVEWSTADTGYTDGWTNPPRAIMRQPAAFTGSVTDFIRIGASLYALWGTSLHRWDADAHAWGAGTALGATPVGRGVYFNEAAYFPCGAAGYVRIAESAPGVLGAPSAIAGAATPVANSPVPRSNPRPLLFGLYNENLYCVTTAAEGSVMALSTSGDTNTWVWPYNTPRQTFVAADRSVIPRKLVEFINRDGEAALWLVHSRGANRFDEANIRWVSTNLRDAPPHPDFGRDARVFRPGEDLWIAAGGGDMIQYTNSNVANPASGPGGSGSGIPASKRGSIVSLASDLTNLYALMQGDTALDSAPTMVEDAPGDPLYVPDALATSSLVAYNGKGWRPLWETSAPAGAPTVCLVADPPRANGTIDFRVHWGVGNQAWSMPCRLTMYSAAQGREAGIDEFAPSSYIQWGRYHAGSIARTKLFSHAYVLLEHGQQNVDYVEVEYQTDADPPNVWRTLGTAYDDTQRTILPFRVGTASGAPFSSGLACAWIRPRMRLVGAGAVTSTPIVTAFGMAYLIVPLDAESIIFTVPLPVDTDERTEKTAEQIRALLYGFAEASEFLHLTYQNQTRRAYVAGVSETKPISQDSQGALTINLVEIPTGVADG